MKEISDRHYPPFSDKWITHNFVFVIISIVFFGILGGVYDKFAYVTFEPVDTKYNVSIISTDIIPCYPNRNKITANDYVLTLELIDKDTGDVKYGHACASVYADDIVSSTTLCAESFNRFDSYYPYERNWHTKNTLHWFCYKCEKHDCSDVSMYLHNLTTFPLHVSKSTTHKSKLVLNNLTSVISAHDVILDSMPYFPFLDWGALWILPLGILVIFTIYSKIGTVCDITNDFKLIKNIRDHDDNFIETAYIRFKEMIVLSACTLFGTIYVIKNITFYPYTDKDVIMIHVSFYFWVLTTSYDAVTWYGSITNSFDMRYDASNRFFRNWCNGYLPVVGVLFRSFLNKEDQIKMVTYHNTVKTYHTLVHFLQLIFVAFYLFLIKKSNIDDWDLLYFICLCLHMVLVIIDFICTNYLGCNNNKNSQISTHAPVEMGTTISREISDKENSHVIKVEPLNIVTADVQHTDEKYPTFKYNDTLHV